MPGSKGSLRRVAARASVIAIAAVAIPLSTQVAASAAPNVTYGSGNVVAEEFEHSNYGGGKFTIKLPFDCTATGSDTDYGFANMPSGWDNVVSSFKNYHGCDANHFDGLGFTGASTGLADTTTYIGNAMNDKTSSLKLS